MNYFVDIQNLKCGGCAKTVIDSLSKIEGIHEISVDVDLSKVSFSSEAETTLEIVEKKLRKSGFENFSTFSVDITDEKSL